MDFLEKESKLVECLKAGNKECIKNLTAKCVNEALADNFPGLIANVYNQILEAKSEVKPVHGEMCLLQIVDNIEKANLEDSTKENLIKYWKQTLTIYRVKNGLELDASEKDFAELIMKSDLGKNAPELKYKTGE